MAKPKEGLQSPSAKPQDAADGYKIGDPGAFARNMVQVGVRSR